MSYLCLERGSAGNFTTGEKKKKKGGRLHCWQPLSVSHSLFLFGCTHHTTPNHPTPLSELLLLENNIPKKKTLLGILHKNNSGSELHMKNEFKSYKFLQNLMRKAKLRRAFLGFTSSSKRGRAGRAGFLKLLQLCSFTTSASYEETTHTEEILTPRSLSTTPEQRDP